MEQKEKRSFGQIMRSLHRDLGFFVTGLAIIYSISGIVLIYRDTDFMKREVSAEKKLDAGLGNEELGIALRMREFEVIKTEGEIVYFENGTYNLKTGIAQYTYKELPSWLSSINKLHKSSSRNTVHWFTTLFGLSLLFLCISSFWMFKPKSRLFRRGLLFTACGIILTVVLLLI